MLQYYIPVALQIQNLAEEIEENQRLKLLAESNMSLVHVQIRNITENIGMRLYIGKLIS